MKPTTDEVLAWAREAGAAAFVFKDGTPADQMHIVGTGLFKKLATIAYAAGAAAMKERAAKVCETLHETSWPDTIAAAIRALGDDE